MKTKKITSFFLCTILLSGLLSCKDKNDPIAGNCESLSSEYTAKLNAFSAAPSKASCTVLVTSLSNLVNKCTILTPAERKTYNDSLADIDCNAFQ